MSKLIGLMAIVFSFQCSAAFLPFTSCTTKTCNLGGTPPVSIIRNDSKGCVVVSSAGVLTRSDSKQKCAGTGSNKTIVLKDGSGDFLRLRVGFYLKSNNEYGIAIFKK